MKKILVVAAHPDDEILGVGGTVARHAQNGDIVFALILGEGQTSRWNIRDDADFTTVERLHQDTLLAAEIIGFSKVYFTDFPDNRFDTVALLDVVKCVEKYIEMVQPDIIYTHYKGDLNIDHQISAQAVVTATRPLNCCSVKEIYAFETVSSTEWNFGNRLNAFYPNVFIDIEPYFGRKCEAMKKYKTELCRFPHPRSLEMLDIVARRWGGSREKVCRGL